MLRCRTEWYRTGGSRPRAGERGTIIPALAMVVAVMAVATSALLTTMGNGRRVQLNRKSIRARQIAETGVAKALYEMERRSDLDSTAGIGNVAGTIGGGFYAATTTQIGRNYYRIECQGTFNQARRSVEVFAAGPLSVYALGALVSKADIEMVGTFGMDSYDSRDGTYASQAVNTDSWGTFAKENATVSSNLGIDAGPNAIVRGDAHPGPSSTFTYHKNTRVSGTIDNLDEKMDLPDPPLEDFVGAYNNNMNGTWSSVGSGTHYDPKTMGLLVDGGTKVVLKAGTYFFTSLTLTGGAQLQVSGDTKIYLTGNIDISGGNLLNYAGNPGAVEIIAHPYAVGPSTPPSPPQFEFAGTPGSGFVFYGPAYDVIAGGTGDFFGAIVGNRVSVTGITLHYDEALAEDPDLTSVSKRIRKYMRVFSRELGRPAF